MTKKVTATTIMSLVFASILIIGTSLTCVQPEYFCLVQYSSDVDSVCNQFREQVAYPVCLETPEKYLSFQQIGILLNNSALAKPFFQDCNCSCTTVSRSTYTRDTSDCFNRGFTAGTGQCPSDAYLSCDQLETVLCPVLPLGPTGGTGLSCQPSN